MRYHNNLLQYYTETGVPKVAFTWVEAEQENDDTSFNVFNSEAAAFYEIHRLRANGKNLYLCLGTGRSCSTCIYKVATVEELVGDSINFLYRAFPEDGDETEWTNCFLFDARMDDIEEFAFDEKTQALTYIYREDAYSKDPDSLINKGRLVFNGVKFISKPY
jgi:hypothetical protein